MLRASSLIFVFVAILGLFAKAAQAQTRADQATTLRDEGDCVQSAFKTPKPAATQIIAICTRALSRPYTGPPMNLYDRPTLLTARGYAHAANNDFDRALADFTAAVRGNAKHADAYAGRARLLWSRGEYDRAIEDYAAAHRLNSFYSSDLINAHVGRANMLSEQAQDAKAIAHLDAAIRLNPRSSDLHEQRAKLHDKTGEYRRAVADWTFVLQNLQAGSGMRPFHLRARGTSYERAGENDKALADYRDAIALNPDLPMSNHDSRPLRLKLGAGAEPATPPAPLAAAPAAQQQAIAAATAPAQTVVSSPAERRVALVIGNGDYRHSTKLANPRNDASDIAAALRKLSFDVIEGRDLDRRGMEDRIRDFGRKLDRATMALFFYAGHGIQVGGKNYLIPIDAKLERAGDLTLDTIDLGQVLAQMEVERRVNLVFLDACRDNPLARSFARSLGTRSTAVGQGLASIQSAIGTMIAYATQPDNVALDGEGRNSPFTAALLKHIATPNLHISLMMQRVRGDVIAATREKQVPWDHSSLIGDVVLAR